MISFFTVPKPFVGHIGMIQENALRSWRAVQPQCQIIMLGDEVGVSQVSQRMGLTHATDVEKNAHGTPLLDSVFHRAQELAEFPLMCYVNTDIILPPGFGQLPAGASDTPFLVVGQRWDMDIDARLDTSDPAWFERLRSDVAARGRKHDPSGSDYFLFRRGDTVGELLPFAVGRPGWDNWMIYHARQLHVPVINATSSWQVVHQNHDYAHVPDRRDESWEGPEADANRGLLTAHAHPFTLVHATHTLRAGVVRRRVGRPFAEALRRSGTTIRRILQLMRQSISSLAARITKR